MRRSRILRLGMVTSYFSWRNRALLGILYHLKFLAKAAVTRATQSSRLLAKFFVTHPSQDVFSPHLSPDALVLVASRYSFKYRGVTPCTSHVKVDADRC